jgi:sulfonate transport system substrate-binding protein
VENRQYYLAYRPFATSHADLLRIIQEEIAKTDAWAADHQPEVVALLAKHTGLDSARWAGDLASGLCTGRSRRRPSPISRTSPIPSSSSA